MLERWIKKLDTINNAFASVRESQGEQTRLIAEAQETLKKIEKSLGAMLQDN